MRLRRISILNVAPSFAICSALLTIWFQLCQASPMPRMVRPFVPGSSVVKSQQFKEVIDSLTGVKLSIPHGLVSGPTPAAWGNNWITADKRLRIAALRFHKDLAAVYAPIRNRTGRRITLNEYDGTSFTLQGEDPAEGTVFHVQATERNGEVHGISITYERWARTEMVPIVSTIVRSYVPFPDRTSDYPPTSVSVVTPQPATMPSGPSSNGAEIAELRAQIARLKEQIAQLKEEKERRDREAREEEIRREEREKAAQKLKAIEEKLLSAELQLKNQEVIRRRNEAYAIQPVGSSPLPGGQRLAFVVGIDSYPELGSDQQLQKAVNDARLMERTFSELGFEVIPVAENLTRRAFARNWQAFLRKIQPGSVVAFFFSGHGVQLQGGNYLIPSDISKLQPDSPEMLQLEALSFTQLYSDILGRHPKVSLLILDACRDNPFRASGGRSLGESRGLVAVKPIEGSFVIYSANADEKAWDTLPSDPPAERNSVFTRVLAPMLKQPSVPLQEVARRVRQKVAELASRAGHKQWPSYYDGLTGNVCLVGSCRPTANVSR